MNEYYIYRVVITDDEHPIHGLLYEKKDHLILMA